MRLSSDDGLLSRDGKDVALVLVGLTVAYATEALWTAGSQRNALALSRGDDLPKWPLLVC